MELDDQDAILETLPGIRATVSGLRLDDGTPNISALAELFAMSPEEVQNTCALSEGRNHRVLERCAYLLVLNPDPENFRRWLQTRNEELGGRTPLEAIRGGKASIVADMVTDVLTNRGG